jgi:hypothetical protein
VTTKILAAWDRFWFRPASPVGLLAARAILSASALWILLSRPDLPELFSWPRAFWHSVHPALASRFLIFGLPVGAERALFVLLLLALPAAALGLSPRISCLTAAVLLYHFAPLEDIFASQGGPFFRGLTVPVLGFFLLSFARAPRRGMAPSPELRWPFAAIQVAFAFTYLLSGLSKLVSVGPAWASARNFEGLVLGLMMPETEPRWAHVFVGNALLCGLGGVAGLLLDFLAVWAVWRPRTARWIVPILLLGHAAIAQVFGVNFLAFPQLALLLDWDAIAARRPATASLSSAGAVP